MTPGNLEKYIRIAAFLESPILRFVIDGDDFQPEMQEIHSIIRHALPLLEANKIVLAIENHDRFKAAAFVEIVEKSR